MVANPLAGDSASPASASASLILRAPAGEVQWPGVRAPRAWCSRPSRRSGTGEGASGQGDPAQAGLRARRSRQLQSRISRRGQGPHQPLRPWRGRWCGRGGSGHLAAGGPAPVYLYPTCLLTSPPRAQGTPWGRDAAARKCGRVQVHARLLPCSGHLKEQHRHGACVCSTAAHKVLGKIRLLFVEKN